jgi:hypothetical protein
MDYQLIEDVVLRSVKRRGIIYNSASCSAVAKSPVTTPAGE